MKLTCDREKVAARLSDGGQRGPGPQPQADPAERQARSRRGDGDAHGHRPGGRHPHRGAGVSGRSARAAWSCRSTASARSCAKAPTRSCALESDGAKTLVRGERSEFQLPAENPDEFPDVVRFEEEKYHELPARLLPRAGPPHGLRHRQREQPLRPGRRAAGVGGRQDHRRGHRRPPAGPQEGPAKAVGGHADRRQRRSSPRGRCN